MIKTPSNLEFLLHCYYSNEVHERHDAPAIQEGIDYLYQSDMIWQAQYVPGKCASVWNVTEKGEAYIKHLMQVPFPVANWEIPAPE